MHSIKKAVIVTCFDTNNYDVRTKFVEEALLNQNYQVTIIASDFDHRRKIYANIDRNNVMLVHVPSYKRNLSLRRMYSHYVFSKKVQKIVENLDVDVIYGITPPNCLWRTFKKIKRVKTNVKIISDVMDMWPESTPVSSGVKRLVFPLTKVWSSIRDKNIDCVDGIIFECKLFYKHLEKEIRNAKSKVIYLCKEDYIKKTIFHEYTDGAPLKILYIGSVNHLIDMDLIISFMKKLSMKRSCELVVIGNGDKLTELVDKCEKNNILVNNYGSIFDDLKKKEIIMQCHYALNIMKREVFVGVTMKSLEYFYWGLGIINNIPADTADIIVDQRCGFNINEHNMDDIINQIIMMREDEYHLLSDRSRAVYNQYFRKESIVDSLEHFISDIVRG